MGALEKHYADDVARSSWQANRYDRIEAGLWNAALSEALENLLTELLPSEDFNTHFDLERAAKDLAGRYFADGDAKAEVAELLRKRGLDETAIEAEAFRLRAPELEILNRMKAFQFSRRDKSIFILAEIRQRGSQLTNNTVDESEPPRLVEVVKRGADHG